MSQERLYFLMRRYVDGGIGEQEFTELRELMDRGEGADAAFRKVFDELFDANGPQQDMSADRARRMLTQIYTSEPLVIEMPSNRRTGLLSRIGLNKRSVGWAAAALLIIAGGYLVYRYRSKPVAPIVYRDLPAGSNKAVLTLANGQQIVLGDSAKGMLAAQGDIRVIQLDSGQLTYQAAANPGNVSDGGYNTLVTPRGGQYKVTLPDGTRVWLNSATKLQYPVAFTGGTRKVELSGEAYFEVAKNSRQPFTVAADGMNVDVLGTDFNINAYSDEDSVRTTLVHGAVRLANKGETLEIHPGQQGSVARSGKKIVVSRPDVEEVVAWKNGEFIFYSQPLQVVMRQISRWYDVDIEYRGTPSEASYTGNLSRTSKASALLDMIETVGDVHFEIEAHKIVVLPGRKS